MTAGHSDAWGSARARRDRPRSGDAIHDTVWGGALVLVGTALLLDRLGIIEIGNWWRLWPLALVAWGSEVLLRAWSRRPGSDDHIEQ